MTTEESQLQSAPAASERLNIPDVQNQDNSEQAASSRLSEAGSKPAEDLTPGAQDPSPAAASGQKQSVTDNSEYPKANEKREHDPDALYADTDKPDVEDSSAPSAKKQKTDESSAQVESDTPALITTGPGANGESKEGGRAKKVRDVLKKERVIPADGIGSRTRSRTKAT